jgi:hypothetical protein
LFFDDLRVINIGIHGWFDVVPLVSGLGEKGKRWDYDLEKKADGLTKFTRKMQSNSSIQWQQSK